jgi:O-antigen/teichoic acid export membrane protein
VTLRERILQGGAYLAAREVAGIGVRLGGVLLLTRLLGPAEFGLYAGPAAIVTFLGFVAQWGCEVFLIRQEDEPPDEVYETVFTYLLASSLAVGAGALALSYLVEAVAGPSAFFGPFRLLLVALPLNVLWAPAQARLERALRFRAMAVLELGGDVVLYGTAVALAAATDLGAFAAVAGYIAWQGFLLTASFALAAFVPRLRFDRHTLRSAFRFGATFSVSSWIERARELVNPLVVGPALGAAAVGHVALALRLGETLAFVMRASWRISIVALGRLQSQRERLRRAFEEGMALQLLAAGTVLAAFALVADIGIPLVFGDRWRPVLDVFPLVAASYLLMATFSLHGSLLYVLQRNSRMIAINTGRLAALTVSASVLVPWLGIAGFGLALLVGQVGYLLLDREVRRVFDYRFRRATPWLIALAPPLFIPLTGWPVGVLLLVPAVGVLAARHPRAQLRGYARTFLSGLSRARAA